MIDHVAARRLAAAALDGALEPSDATALDGTPARLRRLAAASRTPCAGTPSRSDAWTSGRSPSRSGRASPSPPSMAGVAVTSVAGSGSSRSARSCWWRWAAARSAAAGAGPRHHRATPSRGTPTSSTCRRRTSASSLAARPSPPASPRSPSSSDPGDATYRTLEATWQEHGVEQRLYLYFGGDATSWWVDEIRIYNGAQQGEWLYATGQFFRSPLGTVWRGNLDIEMRDADHVGGTPARVHFGGLALASRPFDGVNEPPAGVGVVLGTADRPFGPGGPLHCSGILQMTPAQAEAQLLALGYSLSWRLDRTTGPNTGFAEPTKRAPAGVIIEEPSPGQDGELIVFVAPFGDERAVPIPFPDDCPVAGPSAPPPTPVASPAP